MIQSIQQWTISKNKLDLILTYFYYSNMNLMYQNRIQRLFQIIVEIKTQHVKDVRNLCKKLNISKSQFYNDRKLLSDMGFCFNYNRGQGFFIITKDITLPVDNLTISEQLSLVMALRHLSAAGDHILMYEGLKAAKKIASRLPEPLRANLFDDIVLKGGFGVDSEILERLQQAITDNMQVALTYRRPNQGTDAVETVDPYHIFFKRRALYVEGYSWGEKGIRVYRLSRIQRVVFKSKGFAVKEAYDFGRRYRNAFSAFGGETTEKVVVRFERRIRPYIEESLWHHSQILAPEEDGAIRFSVDVAEPREVLWWALSWGPEAEILAPEWLRDEAKTQTSRMAALYR